jgi:hypothetical protein
MNLALLTPASRPVSTPRVRRVHDGVQIDVAHRTLTRCRITVLVPALVGEREQERVVAASESAVGARSLFSLFPAEV